MSDQPYSKSQAVVSLEQIVSRVTSQLKATTHMAAQDRWDSVTTIVSDVIDSLSSVLDDVEDAEDEEALGARLDNRMSPAERRGATWMRAAIMKRLKERNLDDACILVRGMDVPHFRPGRSAPTSVDDMLRQQMRQQQPTYAQQRKANRRVRVERRRAR